jgi:hypothetical protein
VFGNFAKCWERERGPKIFRAPNRRRAPIMGFSLLVIWRHARWGVSRIRFIWETCSMGRISHLIHMGDVLNVAHLTFDSYGRHSIEGRVSHMNQKRDVWYMDTSPFNLRHPARYQSLVPPRLLYIMLTSF